MKVSGEAVPLALVHHANQYLITNGYLDREGMNDILGLGGPFWHEGFHRRGLLPLLQMHLDYRVPLNLHMSGTLIETLAWHYPESFALVKQLRRAGLLELVGSTFSQNIMTLFSDEYNLRQMNEELWHYRQYLGCDPQSVKTFWVPERVWDTEKLAGVLRSERLANGGYERVLLDDRMIFEVGRGYTGSARERFDRNGRCDRSALMTWEIEGGEGLVMFPIAKELRLHIPPQGVEAWGRVDAHLRRIEASADERAIAVYGDDLERAAGVGGWDSTHPVRYEQFLRWLVEQDWIEPVLIGEWAEAHPPAGVRKIERGTFYELAREWNAGEDYRGWHEDPRCNEHRNYLREAERALTEAEKRGGEKSLLELGWKHLLHSAYETSWHSRADETAAHDRVEHDGQAMWLAPWAAALTSHARSCLVIARAAEWFNRRDGAAHTELADVDGDGEKELVLKSDRLYAVLSPAHGGRLIYLFELGERRARLVVGNISDDWNLQEELNKYMDSPRNHPGGLADVGHEHDRHHVEIRRARGSEATAVLRNVEPKSALFGTEKLLTLSAENGHLCVSYALPEETWRLSTEFCLSPDYHKLLRYGRRGIAEFNGNDWKGWRNGSARVWVRIDPRQSTIWDAPYQSECGHGFNLRITSFSKEFHLELGVGIPAGSCRSGAHGNGRHVSDAVIPPAASAAVPTTTAGVMAARVGGRAHGHYVPGSEGSRARNRPNRSAGTAEILARRDGELGARVFKNAEQVELVTNPHFMRKFLNRHLPLMRDRWMSVEACRIRVMRPHHNKLTLEYNLQLAPGKSRDVFTHTMVGTWRQDVRNTHMHGLLGALWDAGFSQTNDLAVARPVGYWERLHLRLRERVGGKVFKEWLYYRDADLRNPLRRVAAWLAKFHGSGLSVPRKFERAKELRDLEGWLRDLASSREPWLAHERKRIERVLADFISAQESLKGAPHLLTHGDFHPENIFVRGRAVTVIDFEQCTMNDPMSDLGYFLAQLDIQAERYWNKRGRPNPLKLAPLAECFLGEYARFRRETGFETIPFFSARTYLKHLVHTVRMFGSDNPRSVSLWLDKVENCLEAVRAREKARRAYAGGKS